MALQVQADVPHDHHPALAAAAAHGHRHDLVVLRSRGRHDHAVGPVSIGDAPHRLGDVAVARGESVLHAAVARDRDPLGIEVCTDHAAPMGAQQLVRDLPEDAHAYHHEGLAERRCRSPDPLHCDGAEGDRARMLRREPRRDAHRQVDRHVDVLGMVGNAGTGTGDQVARPKAVHMISDGHHFACCGVARRRAGGEHPGHAVPDPLHALVAHQMHHLLCMVGLLQRARPEREGAHPHPGHLGADRDAGVLDPHKNVA